MIKPRMMYQIIQKYLESPEAIVITGRRRTGKTTLMKHIFEQIKSMQKGTK